MLDVIRPALVAATLDPNLKLVRQLEQLEQETLELSQPLVAEVVRLVAEFLADPNPHRLLELEQQLGERLRMFGAGVMGAALNRVEPESADEMPQHIEYEGSDFRLRRDGKTPHRNVATCFGTVTLHRFAYRHCDRNDAHCIFPLELQLGLIQGATPNLASLAGQFHAESGGTQRRTLAWLKQQHGVAMGEGRLRKLITELAGGMSQQRMQAQAAKLCELLATANVSKGRHKIGLAVGRDGITLCEHKHRCWEVASSGTVTVYDRRGRRLGSVYLAFAPQSGQLQMTAALNELIQETLRRWEGPLPRLTYIADAGDNETSYYEKHLKKMRHPRTGQRLDWIRIVDYYHASQRIWTVSELLFGKRYREPARNAWARRMCSLLKEENGPKRVLNSMAALHKNVKLSERKEEEYQVATNYIRRRTGQMQYFEYRKKGLPIGSGVTEAACKTIYTQRLKLSGMRWTKTGAQAVLDLRVILLSGIWKQTFAAMLTERSQRDKIKTYPKTPPITEQIAA